MKFSLALALLLASSMFVSLTHQKSRRVKIDCPQSEGGGGPTGPGTVGDGSTQPPQPLQLAQQTLPVIVICS